MEPTLSELVNINPDPGSPAPIIDNSALVDRLNQQSRYHAENQWRKYNSFLENKKDLFKNISDIQGLAVAPQDKEVLNKQAAEILGDILKNPSVALGGRGYDEVQSKIAKFKSSSMLSKQNKLDDDANGMFMDRNPELFTEENKAKREGFWKNQLGSRQSVLLDMPTIFDEKTTFEGILKSATQPYTAVVGADGKAGQGYIESGNEINPNAITDAWKLALQGQKDKYGHSIYNAVKLNYDKLPPAEKQKYENEGGIEQYFADRGKSYVDAYFPEGTYEKTSDGNYRFGKKLAADPNFLGAERLKLQQQELAQKAANDKATLAVRWANYGLAKARLDDADTDDLIGADSVINEALSTINNGKPIEVIDEGTGKKQVQLRISDPSLLQSFGTIDKDYGVTNVPDAMNYNTKTNQVTLLYGTKNKAGGLNVTKEVPLDQRAWLKLIAKRSFPNKDIGKVNSLIEDILSKNGNSLFDLTKKVNKQSETVAPEVKGDKKPYNSIFKPLPKSVPKTTSKGLPIIQ